MFGHHPLQGRTFTEHFLAIKVSDQILLGEGCLESGQQGFGTALICGPVGLGLFRGELRQLR